MVGAVAFGLVVGYLLYVNDSFPAQREPFGNYAVVQSTSFNGTEIAFRIVWQNATALPLYAQVNSPSSDAANTPVCDVGLTSVSSGQSIFMPFTISPTSASLSNVNLAIAVRVPATGTEFTVVYNVPSILATNGNIVPSDISCQQPAAIE